MPAERITVTESDRVAIDYVLDTIIDAFGTEDQQFKDEVDKIGATRGLGNPTRFSKYTAVLKSLPQPIYELSAELQDRIKQTHDHSIKSAHVAQKAADLCTEAADLWDKLAELDKSNATPAPPKVLKICSKASKYLVKANIHILAAEVYETISWELKWGLSFAIWMLMASVKLRGRKNAPRL